MLSGTADEARIGKALAAGALAGIPKSAALAVLVAAVRRAAQGLEAMHPERRRQFIDAYRRRQERGRMLGRRLASLTGASAPSSTASPKVSGRSRSPTSAWSRSRQCEHRSGRSWESSGRLPTRSRRAPERVPASDGGLTTLSRQRCQTSTLRLPRCLHRPRPAPGRPAAPHVSDANEAHESGRSGTQIRPQRSVCLRRTEDGPYGRNDDEIDSDGMVRSGTSASKWATGGHARRPSSAALEGSRRSVTRDAD